MRWANRSAEAELRKPMTGLSGCPRAFSGHATAASAAMNARRLVCRERSIVTGDGGRFTTPPPSRLEARSRLSKHSCSFDHLIGACEERRRQLEAEPFCGRAVNYEFKPGRLLDRELTRLLTS